jgi:hypothetical protein
MLNNKTKKKLKYKKKPKKTLNYIYTCIEH